MTGTGGLVLLVYAISQAPRYGWGASRTLAVLAAAVALLIAFVVIERRVRFEIALDSAEKSRLKLSSRLLAVAQQVRTGTP